VYDDETQVAAADELSLLEEKSDSLEKHLSLLRVDAEQTHTDDSIARQRRKSKKLQKEILRCIDMHKECTARIIQVKNTLKMGRAAQKLVQEQDKRRALRQIKASVSGVRSLPVGERSLAWTMAMHARLGDKIDCVAKVIDGQELILAEIRNLCLTKNAAAVHKDNCAWLAIKAEAFFSEPSHGVVMEPMYAILAKIDNAGVKSRNDSPAEHGVQATLDVFCAHDVSCLSDDEQVTMRHMLFSTEFIDRRFNEGLIHRNLKQDCRIYIAKYGAKMIERLKNFSAGLFTLITSSSSSHTLCLIVQHTTLSENSHRLPTEIMMKERIIPIITEQDACVILPSYMDFFCQISIYNLDGQDLVLSGNPLCGSAQLLGNDFRVLGNEDDDIPMHNSNVVPAHGFGHLHEIYFPKGNPRLKYCLRDAKNNVVLTFFLVHNFGV